MASAHEIALLRRAAKIETYRRDYLRFAAEQQYIIDKDGVLRRFELFPTQQMVEHVIEEQYKEFGWIRIMEFKARQHGGSTHGVSRACHRVFLNENVSALILAQDDTTASNLFDMAGRMYDSMDKDIKPVRRYLTKQEIVLENPDVKTRSDFPGLRSRMAIQSAKNMHAGVGTTRTWLHISEMCRFGNVKELMGSLVPAIPLRPNTAIINESAPFGYGEGRNSFRANCDAAKSGKSPYRFVGIYWWMCPEYFLPLNSHDLLNGRFRVTVDERRLIKRVQEVSRKELGKEVVLTNEQLKYRRIRVQELGQGDDSIGAVLFQQQFPCIAEGQRVGTQRGLIPIEQVCENDRLTSGSVEWAKESGVQKVFRVRTKRGYSVLATAHHPIATIDGGFVRAENSVGVPIALGRPQFATEYHTLRWREPFGVECLLAVDQELARFLGYFVGDGCLLVGKGMKNCVLSIACDGRDTDVAEDIKGLFRRFVGEPTERTLGSKRGGVEIRRGASSSLALIQRLGLYKLIKPHRKVCVPEVIWRSPKPVIREFLRGYFEADASKRGGREVLLSCKERTVLEDIQLLLLGFGIECKIVDSIHTIRAKWSHTGQDRTFIGHELVIGAVGGEIFHREIGFVGKRKQIAHGALKPVSKLAIPQHFIDPVVAVEEIGERPTYDLNVPETRVFDANGILVHNSDYEEGWVTFVNLVFEPYRIEKMRKMYESGPMRRCDIINDDVIDRQTNAPLWIWEDPQPGELYDMGVDTGQGNGGNASAFQVFKRSNNEQVAEYQNNKIAPLDYAKVIYSVGLYYNGAHAGVEVEGIGYAVNEALNQMGYPNIYRWRKRDHAGGGILSPLTGWKTQYDTKRLLVAVAQDRVAHDAVIIHSSRLYGELRYFCQDFSDAGAEVFYASEGDDDLSMAFMITETIMRDEQAIEFPMEKGAQLDRIPTLAERNKRLQEGIEASNAFVDNADQEQFRREDDPWTKFARAMQGKD